VDFGDCRLTNFHLDRHSLIDCHPIAALASEWDGDR
jgi:hypothetical protein